MFGDAEIPPAALSRYPGFLINWVGAKARNRFERALADLGLTVPQFGVLNLIDADPGQTQHALGEATGIDPSTMVATLDALEAEGLVERRPHADDRRKRAVHLTAAGSARLEQARGVAAELTGEVFAALSPAEMAELTRLLRKLAGVED